MQGDIRALSTNRKPMATEVFVNTNAASVTVTLIRRVVEALEAGHAERNIAEAERIPERVVRRIRKFELDRRSRQMNAVGIAVGGMLDNVRHLHREIDESINQELMEDVA